MPDFLFNESDDLVDATDASFDSTDVADRPGDEAAGDYDADEAPWFSQEEEARDHELGTFGDARCCPRHPHVRTSSDDGMSDADCYVCEGESDAACEAHERAQYEFSHPVEVAIERVQAMAYEARLARERASREAEDDDIAF